MGIGEAKNWIDVFLHGCRHLTYLLPILFMLVLFIFLIYLILGLLALHFNLVKSFMGHDLYTCLAPLASVNIFCYFRKVDRGRLLRIVL